MGSMRWSRAVIGCAVVLASESCDDRGPPVLGPGPGGVVQLFIKLTGSDQQSGPPGAALPTAITVVYKEGPNTASLSPIGNQPITWAVTDGGGTINLGSGAVTSGQNQTGTSAPNLGQASVVWTLGQDGVQRLKATTPNASGQGTLDQEFTASVGIPTCLTPRTTHIAPISSSETWTAAASPHRVRAGAVVDGGAVLTIEAGALVCVDPAVFLDFTAGARLEAVGTAAAPIRITRSDPNLLWNGIRLVGGSGVTSHLDYVTIEYADAGLTGIDPVIISHSTIRQSGYLALALSAPGSQFVQSTVDGTQRVDGVIPHAAVEIAQSSIALGNIQFAGRVQGAAGVGMKLGIGNVVMTNCEITGSAGIGIQVVTQVAGRTHTITNCNIFGNGGVGVSNPLVGFPVSARSNWWGDPAGPLGPNGDGVSGDVDAGTPLNAPVSLSFAPSFSGVITANPTAQRIPRHGVDNQKVVVPR
jgi:hypothetical protein